MEKIMEEKNEISVGTRRKYWNELDSKEKIERTREIIKELERGQEKIRRTLVELLRHRHNDDGEAVIIKRAEFYYGEEGQAAIKGDKDKVYF